MDDQFSENVNSWLEDLTNPDPQRQISGLRNLASLPVSSEAIVHRLELCYLNETNPDVSQAAWKALQAPAHFLIQRKLSTADDPLRASIRAEVQIWQEDGLVNERQVRVLGVRLAQKPLPSESLPAVLPEKPLPSQPVPPVQPQTPPAKPLREQTPEPRSSPSLGQVLLSDAAVHAFLYLGAFFVLVAAFILAALVEVARMPILTALTLLFLGSAYGLSRRLPLAGFALYNVGTFLVLITAGAAWQVYSPKGIPQTTYWGIFLLAAAGLWAIGTVRFRSRWFILLAYSGLAAAVMAFGQSASLSGLNSLLIQMVLALGGFAVGYLILQRKLDRFFWPLYILILVQSTFVLLTAMLTTLVWLLDPAYVLPDDWFALSALFAMGFLLYFFSYAVLRGRNPIFILFQPAAVFCLAVFPLMLFGGLNFTIYQACLWIWVYGAVLSLGYKVVQLKLSGEWAVYRFYLITAGLLLCLLPVLIILFSDLQYVTLYLLATGLLYAGLTVHKGEWFTWAACLGAFYMAYSAAFQLPWLRDRGLYPGFVYLVPALIVLGLGAAGIRRKWEAAWTYPLLIFGWLMLTIDVLATIGYVEPVQSGIVFAIYGLSALLAGIYLSIPAFIFPAALCWAIALGFVLDYWTPYRWVYPFLGLATGYSLAGWLLARRDKWQDYSNYLRICGVGLASLTAVSAYVQGAQAASLALIVLAGMTAVETRLTKRAWIGYLATASLAAALITWLASPQVQNWIVYVSLLGLGYSLAGWLLTRWEKGQEYSACLRISGVALVSLTALVSLVGLASLVAQNAYGQGAQAASQVFIVLAVISAVETLLTKHAAIGYSATASLAASLIIWLSMSLAQTWIVYVILSGIGYYLAGWFVERKQSLQAYGEVLLNSGLALGGAACLLAPAQATPLVVIFTSVTAALFVLEAIRRRNVWLGFPACAVFFLAYFEALDQLNTTGPQYYSIAAGLLGVGMHYFLLRSNQKPAAFCTGLVAQMIILSTTYYQLISTEKMAFFLLMFVQSLLLLGYGLFVRSRSFVFLPVLFVALTVLTATFSLLRGLSTALIIGLTGLVLLFLGILGLLSRQKLMNATEQFGQRLSNW